MPRESRDEVAGVLRDLDRRWPETPIVVTTRPIGGFRPGERFRELDLLPFDRSQRRRFLGRWLQRTQGRGGDQGAAGAERWGFFKKLFGRRAEPASPEACVAALDGLLDEDRGLRELAGNPLYLTLMALLLEHGDRPARHRTQLYDQVFALLFRGDHRPGGVPLPNRRAARRALGFLAYGMTQDNRDGEPFDALEERLLAPAAEELRGRLAAEERWQRPLVFLEDVAGHTGILGPHDGPRADWRFWHRTFREALAAEELERRGEEAAPRRR